MAKKLLEWYAKQRHRLDVNGLRYKRGMGISRERAAMGDTLFRKLLGNEWLAPITDAEVLAGRALLGLDLDGATQDEGTVTDFGTTEPVENDARVERETALAEAEALDLRAIETQDALKMAEYFASIDLKQHIKDLRAKLDTAKKEAKAKRDKARRILDADCRRRGIERGKKDGPIGQEAATDTQP